MGLTPTQRTFAGKNADRIDEQVKAYEELVGSRVIATERGIRLRPDQAEEVLRLAKIGRAKEYLDQAAEEAWKRDNG